MFKIKLITQRLVLSQKIIKNKIKNVVFFEKYEPKKYTFGTFAAITGSAVFGASAITITASNRTVIGSNSISLGGYDIGGKKDFILLAARKPNKFQRLMIKLVFGWKWINKEEL
jgi:hypothetical protein